MLKRTIGKELDSLNDYYNDMVYVKSPNGENYFVDTPTDEYTFKYHLSQGYTFYEVMCEPHSKEVEDWVTILNNFVICEYNDEVYDMAENLVREGYKVVKDASK